MNLAVRNFSDVRKSGIVDNVVHECMTEGDVEIDGARFGCANQELMARGRSDAWSLVWQERDNKVGSSGASVTLLNPMTYGYVIIILYYIASSLRHYVILVYKKESKARVARVVVIRYGMRDVSALGAAIPRLRLS